MPPKRKGGRRGGKKPFNKRQSPHPHSSTPPPPPPGGAPPKNENGHESSVTITTTTTTTTTTSTVKNINQSKIGSSNTKIIDSQSLNPSSSQTSYCIPVPASATTLSSSNINNNNRSLILTSSKRNGLYECDYCGTDISHIPRITCAVCIDFDICLECFTKVDHDAATTATAVSIDGGGNNNVKKIKKESKQDSANNSNGDNSTMSLYEQQEQKKQRHDSTHGYRVADSTRFFLFPSLRGVDVSVVQEKEEEIEGKEHVEKGHQQQQQVKQEENGMITTDTTTITTDTTAETEKENNDDDTKTNKNDDSTTTTTNTNTTVPQQQNDNTISSKKNEKLHSRNEGDDTETIEHGHTSKRRKLNPEHDDEDDHNKNDETINPEKVNQETKEMDDDVTATTTKEKMTKSEEYNKKGGDDDKSNEDLVNSNKNVNIDNNANKNSNNDDNFNNNDNNQLKEIANDEKTSMDVDQNKTGSMEIEMKENDDSKRTKSDITNDTNEDTKSNKDKDPATTTATSNENAMEGITSTFIKTTNNDNSNQPIKRYTVTDDTRYMWTVEEDLRLLEAISTFGLGNWADISEEVSGTSRSTNKTPKKCMERYIDDYLGRYGHILPEYTLVKKMVDVALVVDEKEKDNSTSSQNNEKVEKQLPQQQTDGNDNQFNSRKRARPNDDITIQKAQVALRTNNTEYCVVKTSSLPGYDQIWPNPYIPPVSNINKKNIQIGDDVGRDHAVRCEQAYVKEITGAINSDEANKIQSEWESKLNQPGGPTVLPPRPEDVKKLPGAELAGYMPRRGDFDLEWENDADKLLEDMEFSPGDTPEEREIKIKVIEIYNSKLDEREKRKQFLKDHDLLDYRKKQKEDRKLPADERDLVNRMRLFARFHTAEEHKKLLDELLKAKRLRKEIARLQMYQRMGFTSLVDVERFELDRNRSEIHRLAYRQKEKEQEEEIAAAARAAGEREANAFAMAEEKETYHRQYKNSDRKNRRSINRNEGSNVSTISSITSVLENVNEYPTTATKEVKESEKANTQPVENNETPKIEMTSTQNANQPSVDDASTKESTQPKATANNTTVADDSCIDLLSTKEIKFCEKVQLQPHLYLKVKKVLIHESLTSGILDDVKKSDQRSVVKIDVKTKGDIVRFILRAGWIPDAKKA